MILKRANHNWDEIFQARRTAKREREGKKERKEKSVAIERKNYTAAQKKREEREKKWRGKRDETCATL